MRKVHRTLRGAAYDMEGLRDRHATTMAATPMGAPKMNARGDLLGAGGQIVKAREEISREYYAMGGPEIDRVGMDRLKAMATPVSPIDPNFYKRPTPQSFDDIEFLTPEQIVAQAQMQAQMQAEGQSGDPMVEPTPRASARKSKLKDDTE